MHPARLHRAWLVLLVAGCGSGAKPIDRVLHLDLRLADGRSPAAVLAEGRAPLSTRFDLGEQGPWTSTGEAGARTLRLPGPISASIYGHLEVTAEGGGRATIHAAWTSDGTPRESVAELLPTIRANSLVLELAELSGWDGEVRDLALTFDAAGPASILGASLLPTTPFGGWEPLESVDVDPRERSGDAGLIALGTQSYRAWPTDVGVPLFATVEVPAGGRLSVRAGMLIAAKARFSVAVRNGDAWRQLEAVDAGAEWTPLSIDLGALAGREVDLRFLVSLPTGELVPTRDVPADLRAAWGEPIVTGERPTSGRPNIVLITLDTTRSDAFDQGFTPRLEQLAARGARFDQAFATTNSTVPSHASIFTGLPIVEHGALGNRHAFGTENLTAAERLRALGYHTSAAISMNGLRPGYGFGQGFDRYELAHPGAANDGASTLATAVGWIEERGRDRAPFFLWLHLFDAHTPYGPPDAFAAAFLAEHGLKRPPRDADPATMPVWDEPPAQLAFATGASSLEWMRFEYQLSVAYADFLVGRFLDSLAAAGLAENTLLVVTADHGESFGERDFWFEHANVYPEVIHVPLILAGPGVPNGTRSSQRVSSIDILPTMLMAAGRPDASLAGLDLRKLATEEREPDRRIWFQLSNGGQTGFRDPGLHFVATLSDGLQWIAGAEKDERGVRVPRMNGEPVGTNHLFDLRHDPGCEQDRAAAEPERAAAARAEVLAWLDSRIRARAERRNLSAEEERQLQALGYVDYEEQ